MSIFERLFRWKASKPDVARMAAEKDVEGLISALRYEAKEKGGDWLERRLRTPRVRRAAAAALGEMRCKEAVEPLIAALKDDSSHILANVREAAAEALGKIGDKRAVKPLIEALEDPSASTRAAATKALCKIEWEPTDESDKALYYWATQQWDKLARLGKPALEFLSAKLHSWKAWEQQYVGHATPGKSRPYFAIEALGNLGNSQAVDFLISVLKGGYNHILKDTVLVRTWPSPEPGDYDYYRWHYLEVRAKAAEALGKIGDKRAIEPLIAALRDKDDRVQQAAAEALGKIADERAVEPLIAALKGENSRIRKVAAETLGKIGNKWAIRPLVEALKDEKVEVRKSAAKALENIGWQPTNESEKAAYYVAIGDWDKVARLDGPAVDILISDLQIKGLQQAALHQLVKLGDERAAEFIVKQLGQIRCFDIVEALKKLIGVERSVKLLIAALEDKEFKGRAAAAEALGMIRDARAVEPLIAVLEDKKFKGRATVAEALGKIGDTRAVEPLIVALADKEFEERWTAALALGRMRDTRAVEPLISALKDKTRRVPSAAAEALGIIGDERAVEPLIAALKDKKFEDRAAAAEALGRIGNERSVKALIAALKYRISRVPSVAAFQLGEIGDRQAVEPLIRALEDKKFVGDKVTVVEALRKIRDARAVRPLIAALRDDNEYVRRATACALGEIGDERAVNPLIAALTDRDGWVRRASTVALKKLRDRGCSIPDGIV